MTVLLAPRTSLRSPDGSERVMTRRAWWLVVVGFLLPGSAQILAGSKRLGRVGLVATFVLLALAIVGGVLWLVSRAFVLTIVGNAVGLLVLEVLVIAYAILWLVLGLDTLRLAQVAKAAPRARAVVAAVAVLVTVAPAAAAGYTATLIDAGRGLVSNVFAFGGPSVEPIDGQYTFMLLGGDAGADRVGLRPDSITVVSVNAETGAATMIGVPRNLERVPFPEGSVMASQWPNGFDCGTSNCYINAAYTYGQNNPDLFAATTPEGSSPGIEATREAVEGATGIDVQFFVIVDMQGFDDLIDALGGITIDIPEDVPIAIEGGPVEEWIRAGQAVELDGYHALWYARSRAGSNDYARMERQRVVQEAVIAQFTPQTLLTQYAALSSAGQDLVQTDIPQSMIGSLTDLAERTRSLPITNLELVPPQVETFDPDFPAIHAMVDEAIATAATVEEPSPAP
ncbi:MULTISPECIES: LCP family protein [unclassified Agrococcus]|uniref:LCP family protein n=1 Tax=unclassified Agrococcus TaxID=2615065 RepID=UPI00360CEC56